MCSLASSSSGHLLSEPFPDCLMGPSVHPADPSIAPSRACSSLLCPWGSEHSLLGSSQQGALMQCPLGPSLPASLPRALPHLVRVSEVGLGSEHVRTHLDALGGQCPCCQGSGPYLAASGLAHGLLQRQLVAGQKWVEATVLV